MHFLVALVFAGCLSGLAANDEGLVIVNAMWKAGTREANVTNKIRERVHNDLVECPLTVESLGDPYRGRHKTLRITYRYHGVEHTIECAEGRTLKLPPETADAPDATFGGDQRAQIQRITDATRAVGIPKKGMDIVQAVFGTNGIWRDVTGIVRQGVAEDKLQMDLHYPYAELGGDPAKGKGKHLIIGCRLDGTPKVVVFDEINQSISVSLP